MSTAFEKIQHGHAYANAKQAARGVLPWRFAPVLADVPNDFQMPSGASEEELDDYRQAMQRFTDAIHCGNAPIAAMARRQIEATVRAANEKFPTRAKPTPAPASTQPSAAPAPHPLTPQQEIDREISREQYKGKP